MSTSVSLDGSLQHFAINVRLSAFNTVFNGIKYDTPFSAIKSLTMEENLSLDSSVRKLDIMLENWILCWFPRSKMVPLYSKLAI